MGAPGEAAYAGSESERANERLIAAQALALDWKARAEAAEALVADLRELLAASEAMRAGLLAEATPAAPAPAAAGEEADEVDPFAPSAAALEDRQADALEEAQSDYRAIDPQ